MSKKVVFTENAPAPIGPYSQAVWAGNMLFLSGQIAIDPQTNTMNDADVVSETHQVMQNIKAVLTTEGLTFANVVKTSIFLADMNMFGQVNEVYGQYFVAKNATTPVQYPARETVAVKELPKSVRVEISMIAVRF